MRAMISGLRAAQHDMVFFLDGDDVWHPEKLTRCMAEITDETKFCTHDLWYMDATGKALVKESRVSAVLTHARASGHHKMIEEGLLSHGNFVWLGSAFGVSQSRGATQDFIAFCEEKNYIDTCYQDWPLAVWVALQPGGNMSYVDKKLFGYRLHADNYSGASQTLEKLRRNLTKSRDTFRLIEEIIAEMRGSKTVARTYRQVRVRYDLRLASTLSGRGRLLSQFLRAVPWIRPNRENRNLLLVVGLAFLFGPGRAHQIVESRKNK